MTPLSRIFYRPAKPPPAAAAPIASPVEAPPAPAPIAGDDDVAGSEKELATVSNIPTLFPRETIDAVNAAPPLAEGPAPKPVHGRLAGRAEAEAGLFDSGHRPAVRE